MLKRHILLLFAIISLGINLIQAQENNLEKGKEYTLLGVKVIGKVSYSEPTVIAFAGLQVGEKIRIPGDEISLAVKKLWKLGFFSDVNIYVSRIEGENIYLELELNELPKLNEVKFKGVRKGKVDDLIKDTELKKGKIVNENLISNTKYYLENKYRKDGFFNTKVTINTNLVKVDSINEEVNMVVLIDKGKKVKISKIDFEGNQKLTDAELRGALKKTKRKFIGRFWKTSKFIKKDYDEDLSALIDKYKSKGYRDARVLSENVVYNKEKNAIDIDIKVEEGRKYYFGDIRFLGNSVYDNRLLASILNIKKGDVYDGVKLQKRIADNTSPDAEDINNLYQNSGYLWSRINPVETRTVNDTIDFEIRVQEGPVARYNKIIVKGNDKTNDKVIYRELKTKPGEKWNKDLVIRTIRELGALGFFDAEKIRPDPTNMDPAAGKVDLEWTLEEKGSSQVELQGGYGAGGFIGTLGLSFNNFSLKNIFNGKAYRPLPMGDGQKMSLRLQASTFFQVYSLSFTEPWLGGKKPISFFTSLSHSRQFLGNQFTNNVDKERSFNITSLSVGYGKRLKWPDDYFTFQNSVSFQYYQLNNYNTGLFSFGNGSSRSFAFTTALIRDSRGNNPIYPTQGAQFSLSLKFTPPYSLFNGVDYKALFTDEQYKLKHTGNPYFNQNREYINTGDYLTSTGSPTQNFREALTDRSKIDQLRFNWQEFYKVKFSADWYTRIWKKLVMRTRGEFGFLGAYNSDRGVIPFERFFVGGDGLANFALDGREVIQLRGYPNNSLSSQDGGAVYNKYSLELRYPITLGQTASIYALTFLEAGGAFNDLKKFDPFKAQRSAGLGLRVFMPAFGLLGIDFGHGFDPVPGQNAKSGWQTHFIIGQQF